MGTLLEYKCPSCGGPLSFDSQTQQMKCPYCDSDISLEGLLQADDILQEQPQETDWERSASQWQDDPDAHLKTYFCRSCGGDIVTDETTAATHCPYCDNPVVMADNLAGSLRPECIIPFQIDRNGAIEAFSNYLKGKVLLPKVFREENHIQQIKGVYVPFWLFDATAHGDTTFRATKIRSWSDSRYTYTKTSYYSIHRTGSLGFSGVPVDADRNMADDLMESIEPFTLSGAVPFQSAYLAGYFANKYSVDADTGSQRAQERMHASIQAALADTVVGYSSVMPQNSHVHLTGKKVRYALLPVWILNTQYRGKNYRFAMNGQTGRFVGNLPVDWCAFWLWWAGICALTTGIAVGIAWLISNL